MKPFKLNYIGKPKPKFKLGDVVSTNGLGEVCINPNKCGIKATRGFSFTDETILDIKYNNDEKEFWYQTDFFGNYYNETGLKKV
jgi:hypothetical protein